MIEEIKPGDIIAVLNGKWWVKLKVVDWETPRRNSDGKWLFTAENLEHHGMGPCPYMVEPERLKKC